MSLKEAADACNTTVIALKVACVDRVHREMVWSTVLEILHEFVYRPRRLEITIAWLQSDNRIGERKRGNGRELVYRNSRFAHSNRSPAEMPFEFREVVQVRQFVAWTRR